MAPNAPRSLVRHLFALLRDGGIHDRQHRLWVCSYVTWWEVGSTDDMSERDIKAVVSTLEYWKYCGDIEYRCRRIAEKMQGADA